MQYIASASGTQAWGSTCDTTSTLNVAVGDILVMFTCNGNEAALSSAAQTDSNNAFTVVGNTTNWMDGGCAYCVATSANSTATIRATMASAANVMMVVIQFRAEAGETIAYGNGPASAYNNWGSNPTSAQLTSSGAAMWVGALCASEANPSSVQIASAAVDGTVESSLAALGYMDACYKYYSTAKSNATITSTMDPTTWTAQLIYFTITTSAGGDVYSGRGIGRGIARGIMR